MEKQINVTKQKLKTEFPYLYCEERFALCGQPRPLDLEEFKKDSWTHVINLRSNLELENLEFDFFEICQKLGLKYSHIPVIVDGDINKESLEQIHDLLSNKERGSKYVLHCASGARSAIALMSHFLFSKSCTIDELPDLAESFGLYQFKMLDRLTQIMS